MLAYNQRPLPEDEQALLREFFAGRTFTVLQKLIASRIAEHQIESARALQSSQDGKPMQLDSANQHAQKAFGFSQTLEFLQITAHSDSHNTINVSITTSTSDENPT